MSSQVRPKAPSKELLLVSHDPNYKWRVLGAIAVVFFTVTGVTLTAIFSEALAGGYIAGLFGMEFTVVLIVMLLVLRYPTANQEGFSMDNPWVATVFSTIAGIITSLLVNWLGAVQ